MTFKRRGGFSIAVQTQSYANEDRSWIKSMDGMDTCRSITLDASAFAAAHLTAKGAVPSGTVLEKLASGKYGPYTGNRATSEVQTITITGSPTGGTFTITVTDPAGTAETTAAIAYNAAASAVQTALEALDIIDLDDVKVTGSAGGPYTLTFGGQYTGVNMPAVTTTNSFTGGTAPDTTIATTTGGLGGAAGLLFTTTQLGDGSGTDLATAEDPGSALYWEGIVDVNQLPVFAGTNNGELDADARADLIHIRFED